MIKVFFDNAATTPMAPEVIDVMTDIMKNHYGNPSSQHSFGRATRSIIETSRKKIANFLNTSPGNIFFTSGGTEADNMAIKCGIKDHNITHAITSKLSHHAVLHPLEELEKSGVIKLSYVEVNEKGQVSLSNLKELLESHPRTFVSILHANNEIGTIQDITAIGDICKEHNAIFHSDTVQTMAHYRYDLQKINVDFIAASAHKFHGPKGIGFVYISDNIKISPLLSGGSQERNMRAGTENLIGIAAISHAMEMAYEKMEEETEYIKRIKSHMIAELKKHIPQVKFNGMCDDIDNSLYTVLSCSFPETAMAEMLLFNLDIKGIACSGGSACTSGSNKGSHVIQEINPNSKRPSVRFSFSKYNTIEEVDYVVDVLKGLFA
ncbi:MAG: cysteine desulfurase family protein [Flavobacteriales bacterium]|nr:cysteine desulfurase family protein [Flavobacteriales bacterium]